MKRVVMPLSVLVFATTIPLAASYAGTTKPAPILRGFGLSQAPADAPVHVWRGKPRVKYVQNFRVSSEKKLESAALIGAKWFYWGGQCPRLSSFAEKLLFEVFERRWEIRSVRFSRLGKDVCLRGFDVVPPVSFWLPK